MRLLPLLTSALLGIPSAFAATHAVLPGEPIQPKIDIAAPGDVIAIFGGTYPGDVTINKAVRLVEVDGQEVTITGNVTWNGVTNTPPFEGFTVGSAGKGITVNNTTGLVIRNVDALTGFGIVSTGNTDLGVIGGNLSAIQQNGGNLTVEGSTVAGTINADAGSIKTVVIRTNFYSGTWNTIKGYLAYCTNMLLFNYTGSNGSVVVLGCRFTRPYHLQNSVDLRGSNNNFIVANCSITNAEWGYWDNSPQHVGRGIYIAAGANRSLITNNYIYNRYIQGNTAHAKYDFSGGDGIRVEDVTTKILNNIIHQSNWGISAPFGAAVLNNQIFAHYRGTVRSGAVAEGLQTGDPLFVATSTSWQLRADSPAVNSGVNDPNFNDLDGSRNDRGVWGGCLFDPDAWTTNKPVVISFDLAPQQLLKGVDTQVTISNGQAVAQP